MKVYVLSAMLDHGGGEPVAVFWTLEDAKAARPGDWREAPHGGAQRERNDGDGRYFDYLTITQMETPPLASAFADDPVKQFAASVLDGDGPNADAIRDILRA